MPDSQVNYLTQQSNGDVGAVFPGGVQITAYDSTGPGDFGGTPDRSVNWVRQSDGGLVADITGFAQTAAAPIPRINGLSLTADSPDNHFNIAQLRMEAGQTADYAGIKVGAFSLAGGAEDTLVSDTGISAWQYSNMQVNWNLVGITSLTANFPRPFQHIRGCAACSGYANGGAPIVNSITVSVNGSAVGISQFVFNLNSVHHMQYLEFGANYGSVLPAGNYTVSLNYNLATFDGSDVFNGHIFAY